MPIRPSPFNVKCPKCGCMDIFAPLSDAFTLPRCPSCHIQMELNGKAKGLNWANHTKYILQKLIK